jgi:hypothetical protein
MGNSLPEEEEGGAAILAAIKQLQGCNRRLGPLLGEDLHDRLPTIRQQAGAAGCGGLQRSQPEPLVLWGSNVDHIEGAWVWLL